MYWILLLRLTIIIFILIEIMNSFNYAHLYINNLYGTALQ